MRNMPENNVDEELARIDAARAERRAAHSDRRKKQLIIDRAALLSLEDEHGFDNVSALSMSRYVDGLPALVVVRAPTSAEYKRYVQMVRRAKQEDNEGRAKAQELLAESCWIYPPREQQPAVREAFPGVLPSIVLEVTKMAELQNEAEGKG